MKEKAGGPSQNPATLVCTVEECVFSAREHGLLAGGSRALMGLSGLGSTGKEAFEEKKKNIVTKTI